MRRLLASLILIIAAFLCSDASSAAPEFPSELTQFAAYCRNPVFEGAGEGHWDAQIRERGWILRNGDSWRLWYTGYDGTRTGIRRLGLATSSDGLNWVRHPQNPLSGEWIEDGMIVPHKGQLYLFAEGEHDHAKLLVSTDGVHWKLRGMLDIRSENGQPLSPGPFGTPTALFRDGTWYLFYERRDAGVWLATSKDLTSWTNLSDEPVLRPGPDTYDASRIALNQILEHDGRFYGLYHGTDDRDAPALWTSNIAVSDDLRTWTKFSRNPLFPKVANRSSNILVPLTERRYRLFTMHGRVETFLPSPPIQSE